MSEKLLPCPFCGANPHRGLTKVMHCQLHGDPYQHFRIWCPHKCAQVECGDEPRAAKKWNTRAAMQADAAPVAWMPIETAPHDGDMLVTNGPATAVAFRDSGMSSYRFFSLSTQSDLRFAPTHWMPLPAAPVADLVSTSSPVDDRQTGNMSGKPDTAPAVKSDTAPVSDKLRPAVEVWREAKRRHDNCVFADVDAPLEAAAAVIEADRAALVAEIVGDIRATMCDCSGKFIADEIEAKWGGK